MLSLRGRAKAATAAAPATPADTARRRVVASEHKMPSSAKMAAKPKPQDSGIECASTMPNRLGPTQADQLMAALPAR